MFVSVITRKKALGSQVLVFMNQNHRGLESFWAVAGLEASRCYRLQLRYAGIVFQVRRLYERLACDVGRLCKRSLLADNEPFTYIPSWLRRVLTKRANF